MRAAARSPDFVLGDAHGTACSGRVTALVETTLSGMGYTVRRNDPYAGGYITRHYGRPRDGVHALQIEIARSLYMDELRFCGAPALPRCATTCQLWRRLAPVRPGSDRPLTFGHANGARKKMAAPEGTAKFREETSKQGTEVRC